MLFGFWERAVSLHRRRDSSGRTSLTFPAAVNTELQGLLGPVTGGTTDTKSETSRGLEFEVVTNLTRNWTGRLALSRALVHPSNTFTSPSKKIPATNGARSRPTEVKPFHR